METVLERVRKGGALFSRIAVIGCSKSSLHLLQTFSKLKSVGCTRDHIRIFDKSKLITAVDNKCLYGVLQDKNLHYDHIYSKYGFKHIKEIVSINPEEQCFHDQNDMGLHRYESLVLGTGLDYFEYMEKVNPFYNSKIDKNRTNELNICCGQN